MALQTQGKESSKSERQEDTYKSCENDLARLATGKAQKVSDGSERRLEQSSEMMEGLLAHVKKRSVENG